MTQQDKLQGVRSKMHENLEKQKIAMDKMAHYGKQLEKLRERYSKLKDVRDELKGKLL